jgi:hypothetical protein
MASIEADRMVPVVREPRVARRAQARFKPVQPGRVCQREPGALPGTCRKLRAEVARAR